MAVAGSSPSRAGVIVEPLPFIRESRAMWGCHPLHVGGSMEHSCGVEHSGSGRHLPLRVMGIWGSYYPIRGPQLSCHPSGAHGSYTDIYNPPYSPALPGARSRAFSLLAPFRMFLHGALSPPGFRCGGEEAGEVVAGAASLWLLLRARSEQRRLRESSSGASRLSCACAVRLSSQT